MGVLGLVGARQRRTRLGEPLGVTDLQRLLRDQVTEVSPDTLVIAEEFSEWTDSRRRIDLLGIDKEANLVVIELKRTDDGGHMELQAIRYAAMVSTLTSQRAVEIFSEYLNARGRDEDAEQQLLEFLEWEEFDEDKFAQDVRLVLVSADFSKELTSAVLWLNDKDLDIRCVRIKPYAYEGKTLIDVQQVVLDLTRFRGHLILWETGVHDVKARKQIRGRVPAPNGRAATSRPRPRRAGARV